MALTVKRLHGLGNVFMLLPVLASARADGHDVRLVTRAAWIPALASLGLGLDLSSDPDADAFDLDAATELVIPSKHRSHEFADILAVRSPIAPVRLARASPTSIAGPILFAPEAGHLSRVWPGSRELAARLRGRGLTLVGLDREPRLPCDEDLRGQLSLLELMHVVASARCVVCMDSSILQIAMMANVPVLAIFGGIEPAFRVLPGQRARVVAADLPCRPCNKKETCNGRFPCIKDIGVDPVLSALDGIEEVRALEIRRVAS